jgi:phenylalanyl-tRNA synthetase alpha chain
MSDIKSQVSDLQKQFEDNLMDVKSGDDLDTLYLKYFSKSNGLTTKLMRVLPSLSSEEKREYGPKLNQLQNKQKEMIERARADLKRAAIEDPRIDLSYPLPAKETGFLHPTTQVIREMNEFFRYYGYSVVEGPEIETVEYNFRKLNLPEGHPATDLQDTLYVDEDAGVLLRTHTSSVEARVLTDYDPPIRVAFPGKVYRNETLNSTNGAFFHHYQGVVVDKDITMQHLKGTLELFHRFLFGDDVELRFRYKYYPEVSPGMGVDMKCKFCDGKGCNVCKHRGYIEVLGSGMIHYNTLKMCGIDPEVYTGFAFGMGLDRLVMQRFGIDDIRKLYGGGMVYSN